MKRNTNLGDLNGNIKISIIKEQSSYTTMIYGDSDGLESLGKLLINMSKINQDEDFDLPLGERKHEHLNPCYHLSKDSVSTIIGRLDAKGSGEFPENYENEMRNSKNKLFNLMVLTKPKPNTHEANNFEGAFFTCLVNEDYYKNAEKQAITSFLESKWEFIKVTSYCIHDKEFILNNSDFEDDEKKIMLNLFNQSLQSGIEKKIEYTLDIDE